MSAPTSDVDLFCDEVLNDPYPAYAQLRGQGPVVWLSAHDLWAVPRFAEVKAALADWETFSAANGVGVSKEFNRLSAGRAILSTDPPDHTVLRQVLMRDLNTRRLRAITPQVEQLAADLVGDLVERGSFCGVRDLAKVFPLEVVCDFLGLPQEGRGDILELADAGINSFGPVNHRSLESFPKYHRLLTYLTKEAIPPHLAPGSAGETIYAAAEAGEIDRVMAAGLMSAYMVAGIDTTINSIGNALWQLYRHPDQWALVQQDPHEWVAPAMVEVMRHDPPVQLMTRTVARPTRLGGVDLPQGARVLLVYGSACRDERHFPDADAFDIRRRARDHLALGHGVHHCVGAGLARLESHSALHAWASQVREYECGEPVRHLNNVVRGLAQLPVTVRAQVPAAAG